MFGRNNNKVKSKNIPKIIELIKQNKIVPFKKAEFKSRTDLSLRQVNTIFNKDNIESLKNEMVLADINLIAVSGYDFSNNKSTKRYFTDGVISDEKEFAEFKSVSSIKQEQLSAA